MLLIHSSEFIKGSSLQGAIMAFTLEEAKFPSVEPYHFHCRLCCRHRYLDIFAQTLHMNILWRLCWLQPGPTILCSAYTHLFWYLSAFPPPSSFKLLMSFLSLISGICWFKIDLLFSIHSRLMIQSVFDYVTPTGKYSHGIKRACSIQPPLKVLDKNI